LWLIANEIKRNSWLIAYFMTNMEEKYRKVLNLEELPAVGHKTASVDVVHLESLFPVDTHIHA
jgi:endonuclease III